MKDGMIPFPVPGRKGPMEIVIESQKGSDRIEFLAYAIVGISAVLAVALHLASSGSSRGIELEVVKMAGRLVEIIGLV